MKKLLFFCHGAGNGGAERVITTLANGFSQRNYEVLLVTTNKEHNEYKINSQVKRKIIFSEQNNSISRTVDRVKKLRKIINDFLPDCIISFSAVPNMQVLVATLGLKCKVIISERTDPSRYPESGIGRVLRNALYLRAKKIVFQTEDARNYFSKKIQSKGTIIYNPISNRLPEPYTGKRKKVIVGIGSLGEQKNWMVGLKAAEIFLNEHDDYIMRIYGEGPDRTKLQEYIDKSKILNGKVFLMGFSSNIIAEMIDAKMYVSSSDYEGISNAMLEALAIGVPSICTDCPVGGAKMFIEPEQNGILVPVGDYKKLAEAMKRLAEDELLSERFSKMSPKIKKELSLEKILGEWEKEIEN